jgi:hypothetical protein
MTKGMLITDPRDPRLLDPASYAALAMTIRQFRGPIRVASAHGAEIGDASNLDVYEGEADDIDIAAVQANTTAMLATGSGERYPLGDYEMIALRFVVDGTPATVLYVEDYPLPYPCVVDGHAVDRQSAIRMWLGDGDAADHPALALV